MLGRFQCCISFRLGVLNFFQLARKKSICGKKHLEIFLGFLFHLDFLRQKQDIFSRYSTNWKILAAVHPFLVCFNFEILFYFRIIKIFQRIVLISWRGVRREKIFKKQNWRYGMISKKLDTNQLEITSRNKQRFLEKITIFGFFQISENIQYLRKLNLVFFKYFISKKGPGIKNTTRVRKRYF